MAGHHQQGEENLALDISDEGRCTKAETLSLKDTKLDITNEDFEDLQFETNVVTEKIEAFNKALADFVEDHQVTLRQCCYVIGFILYNVFFFGAIYHFTVASKPELQWCDGLGFLIIITIFVYTILFYFKVLKPSYSKFLESKLGVKFQDGIVDRIQISQEDLFRTRWAAPAVYLGIFILILTYLIIDTGGDRDRLKSFFGLIALVFLGFFFSKSPGKVVWRHIAWGLSLQFIFAVFIIKWAVGVAIFNCLGNKVSALLEFADEGSGFVFGYLVNQRPVFLDSLKNDSLAHGVFSEVYENGAMGFVFMFKVLSVIYFLSFLVSMLFYWGAMQWVVAKIGWMLQVTVGTTYCESMNAAANIFLGHTESPLLIQPYLPIMTNSEIHAVMTGGFATIAGTVLAAYISFNIDAAHLLSASVMSAPAALACAKLMYPETKVSKTKYSKNLALAKSNEANVLDAATRGASMAVFLVANIAGTLIAVLAFVAFLNGVLSWCGMLIGFTAEHPLTFELILGKCFIPLSWLMGVPTQDLEDVGLLIGLKTFATEFAAFSKLKTMVHLHPRSKIIATYALCGFSNLASVGISIAALSAMAPTRRGDITSVAFRALVSGSLACFMTACPCQTLSNKPRTELIPETESGIWTDRNLSAQLNCRLRDSRISARNIGMHSSLDGLVVLASEDEANSKMGETKVIYHIDEEDTPYLVKLQMSPKEVTLADLKQVLNKPNYKYFFKSQDDDFGVVKEEIALDSSGLPLFNGRVVCWLELAQGSTVGSNGGGQEGGGGGGGGHHSETDSSISGLPPPGIERGPGVGETRPPSFHGGILAPEDLTESESILSTRQETDDLFDDTESSITSVSQAAAGPSSRRPRLPGPGIPRPGQRPPPMPDTASSMMSSELESSIYEDTEDAQSMASSRFTTSTDHTSVSQQMLRNRQKRRSKRRVPAHLARAGSISSVTDSTMSLNCITVTLNMDTVNFLGISIVGQSNKFGDGDCGIYVGSIMKGGAVALDGRIEPGDMILQVNEISFENMSNDDAVRVLREVVQKPGTEPVRPIDPGAWVAHTAAVRGDYPGRCPSVTTLSASSMVSSHADTEKFIPLGANATSEIVDLEPPESLTNNSGMGAIVRAMQRPDSNLEVRDRMWLKIKISNAFIGSDVVDWLYERVQGFSDRREARKYASQMLKAGFIKHTVNKTSFRPAPPIPTVGNPPGPQTNWGVPLWSDWQGDEVSSTNYGPIYNPSAPPPTASYMPLPYGVPSGGSSGPPGAFGYNAQQPSVISSGGSGSGSQKLRLAGSCSSSESDGRTSTVVSSDGGFRVALAKQEQQQQQQQQLQSGLSGQGVVPRDGPTAPVGRIDYPSGPQPPSYLAAISIQR
ncbi:hypothetical protein TCAL_07561 [Tigriopus californicus]|uniref:Uncharacterized protein n=1 Tax=Tigriopus californicus TaxID=6832 RepID=A0A553PQU2_TIGCA|nr:hypothetical protein TCAL_07561 [Tigriopus californicus]